MGRKSNVKEAASIPPESSEIGDEHETNGVYKKRLRSWKKTSPKSNTNQVKNDETQSWHRSTMYTFPIQLRNDPQSISSNTILSETSTPESVFYCRTISSTSMQTTGDLNNNHVTTWNFENKKRKYHTVSRESFFSEESHIRKDKITTNVNDDPQLTYYQNSMKRLRHSIDNYTIDINRVNERKTVESSTTSSSLINHTNPMDAAVKMVQPIVDIIFNAFEDQLKTIQPTLSNLKTQSSPFSSPMMIPYYPITKPTRPVVLHTINFNIQLSGKDSTMKSIEEHISDEFPIIDRLNENENLQLMSLNRLKQKVISYLKPNHFIADHQRDNGKHDQLQRIAQLAVVGASVLCSYFFL